MQMGLGALSVLLIWQIATYSLSAALSYSNPNLALTLNANNSTARLNLADQAISTEFGDTLAMIDIGAAKAAQAAGLAPSTSANPTSHQPDNKIHDWVSGALASDPLNAHAIASLGALAAFSGDTGAATRFMIGATKRTLRERTAVAWMMRDRFEAGDYSKSLYYADALARLSWQAAQSIMPYLGRLAENPKSSAEFSERLKSNPPWRPTFFDNLSGNISDARTPLSLLLSLKDSNSPPTLNELKAYSALLLQHQMYDLAYNAWLQFLAPEQLAKAGFLFNGGFDFEPSSFAFDWTPAKAKGLLIDRVGRADRPGDMALMIEFGGARIDPVLLSQTVMLPPGTYRFEGLISGNVRARRGLSWSLHCINQATAEAQKLELPTALRPEAWTEFVMPLTVPTSDCGAQVVQLQINSHAPSDTMATGLIKLDDLKIIKSENARAH